jgi:hypothetical protein
MEGTLLLCLHHPREGVFRCVLLESRQASGYPGALCVLSGQGSVKAAGTQDFRQVEARRGFALFPVGILVRGTVLDYRYPVIRY